MDRNEIADAPTADDHATRSGLGRVVAAVVLAAGLVVAALAVFGGDDSTATDSIDVATGATSGTEADAAADAAAEAEDEGTTPTAPPTSTATPASTATEAPPILGVEAELTDLDGWLQSDIDSLADLDGKVHVVQFWTFGCYNCKNTLANLASLYETHDGGGEHFEIVGVHAPEFDYEKDPDAILAAAEELNVSWPIALDTNKKNFRSWQEGRRFWPRTYVVDQNGDIRFDRIGEGAYDKLNATVAWLLENGPGDGDEPTTS